MKQGSMSSSMLVLIGISIFSIGGLLLMLGNLLFFANSLPQDVFECQQSAILSLQIGTTLPSFADSLTRFNVDFNRLPFVCPVREDTISFSELKGRLSSAQKSEMNRLEYKSAAKYALDAKMWKHMQTCYQKMDYGQSPLFSRNLLSTNEATACVVCSIITFDEETQAAFPDTQGFSKMFREKSVPNSDFSLLEISGDHDHIAGGFLVPMYRTDSTQAVVYFRTNEPKFGDLMIDIENGEYYVWDQITGSVGSLIGVEFDKLYDPDPTYFQDFESIAFINYDDATFIENECDTLAAQLEVAQ